MPVVINDFEIVLDPPRAAQAPPTIETAAPPAAEAPAGALPVTPFDLEAAAAHLARRRERVRAH